MEVQEIFSKNLKRYMREKGINQTVLARELDVSNASVSKWCKGKRLPRMEKLDALCEILDIMPSQLLSESDFLYPVEARDLRSLTSLLGVAFNRLRFARFVKESNFTNEELDSKFGIKNYDTENELNDIETLLYKATNTCRDITNSKKLLDG